MLALLQTGLHSIHHNPAEWENPAAFRADRFLPGYVADKSKDGGGGGGGGSSLDASASKAFVPFSRGARGCPGKASSVYHSAQVSRGCAAERSFARALFKTPKSARHALCL